MKNSKDLYLICEKEDGKHLNKSNKVLLGRDYCIWLICFTVVLMITPITANLVNVTQTSLSKHCQMVMPDLIVLLV